MQKTEKSHWEPRYASREKRMQASEIRDLLKLLDKPGVVSFAGGIPDPELSRVMPSRRITNAS